MAANKNDIMFAEMMKKAQSVKEKNEESPNSSNKGIQKVDFKAENSKSSTVKPTLSTTPPERKEPVQKTEDTEKKKESSKKPEKKLDVVFISKGKGKEKRSVTLDKEIIEQIEEIAKKYNTNHSHVINQILKAYFS